MRQKTPLNSTYGKLTVVTELPGGKVSVRCQCGTIKTVLRNNLRSGRVLSCGSAGCRESTYISLETGERMSGPRPFGPSWCSRDSVPVIWARYKDAGEAVSTIALDYGVTAQTVYALFRKVETLGGIEPYMLRLRFERPEEGDEVPVPTVPTPPIERAASPAPAASPTVVVPPLPKPVPGLAPVPPDLD